MTPARLITKEILVFESVKSLRNNGSDPDENAQKKWLAKYPMPRTTIVDGVILCGVFKSMPQGVGESADIHHKYPFSRNQSMALRMLSRIGVCGMPSSLTAFVESQNEYSLPTRTQAAVVTGGLRVISASNWYR